jgi:hypothetical protein
VEGAELHVLEGMGNMAPTSILLEIHPQGLAACGRSEDELRAFLHQAGYTGQTVVEPKTSDVYTTYWTRTQ